MKIIHNGKIYDSARCDILAFEQTYSKHIIARAKNGTIISFYIDGSGRETGEIVWDYTTRSPTAAEALRDFIDNGSRRWATEEVGESLLVKYDLAAIV